MNARNLRLLPTFDAKLLLLCSAHRVHSGSDWHLSAAEKKPSPQTIFPSFHRRSPTLDDYRVRRIGVIAVDLHIVFSISENRLAMMEVSQSKRVHPR